MLAGDNADHFFLLSDFVFLGVSLPSEGDHGAEIGGDGAGDVLLPEVDVGVEPGDLLDRVQVLGHLGVGVGQVGGDKD